MKKLTSAVQLPTDNYLVRVIEEAFGPSKSSGNPMITLSCEIISPETVSIAGEDYNVAGTKIQPSYFTTKTMKNGEVDVEKTEYNKVRLDELTTQFKMPAITDPENPALGFKGKVVWAIVKSEAKAKTKTPTQEQLEAGEKVGDVIIDPMTGEPVISYFPKIDKIYGTPSDDVIAKATAGK